MCPEEEAVFGGLPAFSGPDALREMNGVTLAFIGDAVYELLVRDRVLSGANGRVELLHRRTVSYSNAAFQSEAAKALLPRLTPEELSVFKRGRNAHTGHVPKNKTRAEYQLATALEALFGYLYLTKQNGRLRELFDAVTQISEEYENEKRKTEQNA